MTTMKFEIEKFDGNGDCTLWTKRITTILGSQKALKALKDPKELPATLTKSERETMENVAYGTLVMNITDNVLRQNKNLDENLDEFKKLTNALNQTGEKLGAESEATILINSIHDTYKEVKTTLKYGTNKKAMEIETEEEDWVLDSGCTYHMTSKKNWFVDYKSQEGDLVYMGNNHDCEIIGVGLVLLKLSHNMEVLLKVRIHEGGKTRQSNSYFKKDGRLVYCEKCYKLWNFSKERSLISRDVVFKENEIYMESIKVTPSVEHNLNEPSISHLVEIHSNLKDSNPSSSDQLPKKALPTFRPQEEEEENTEDLTNYNITRDRGRRTIKPPYRFARANCIANSSTETIEDELYSYEDALNSRHNNQWKEAMND
ncbi:Retrovirus-related Pol polyprotein from transposon TNT 1-94 [Cucumis melo var. makuwa]|uniref:Retrovirus-related Pol polyprotein from transposon TNT 1-94 n=1 Tax=Cucumis melo var. makuwa TaxID=1194695 RepID=A0A5A7TKQ1_CUCMM|nr:Retrovirus-related Pol polyprotein from transposon TNT 1-94 [Cucumis melo var. makuwa]